ncbi:MAG: RHS repeat-associated core domain-containing protein, partial [Anaerolineae bacterium]|nr:RHS repeat-associated core domain-containing protein [Anaerolineae bacterium]
TPTRTSTPTQTPTATHTPTRTNTPTVTPTSSTPSFTSASFIYDGDGKRVKSILTMSTGSTTTYFVGGHYEVANEVVTKYYYAGAQRVALRTNGTLNYLLGDHLGSTSLTTDANGNVISEMRYKAWGETRYASGTTPTKYTYTGQYSYVSDFGLHFYNARWYDSSLSRFAQADTIVVEGIQGLDRYAYANNSPVRYIDPSGHDVQCTLDEGCWETNNDGSVGSSGGSPSYIDRSQLTKVDNDSAYSGEQLYQLYIEAWYDKSGWWWDVYGGDNQFSIWEFLDILWSYELGGIGYDDALVQGSVDALSAKIAALGGNTSAAGQLNFLAAWSSSVGRRLNKKFYPNYVDPRGGTYKCNGEICSIGQIIDKP